MPKPLIVNGNNFERRVLNEPAPTVVGFWATWCSPCRTMTPVVREITETYAGRLQVAQLDVDESPDLAQRYGVRAIPTLIFFRNGHPADQMVGVQPQHVLNQKIEKLLES